ncbi:MAG: GIY-YIG nuclease family protein [Candidatus Nanopelagicales bacterium]
MAKFAYDCTATAMWLRILAAHAPARRAGKARKVTLGQRGRLRVCGAGILYVLSADQRSIAVVIAGSLAAAMDELQLDSDTPWSTGHVRQNAHDIEGLGISTEHLRDESPVLLAPGNVVRSGRAIRVWSAAAAARLPQSPGIYRIYCDRGDLADLYIGKTNNLKRRLEQHRHGPTGEIYRWGGWGEGRVYCVDVFTTKVGVGGVVPLQVDLSQAEKDQIEKAGVRAASGTYPALDGKVLGSVVNSSSGGNGGTGKEFATAHTWTSAISPTFVRRVPRWWNDTVNERTIYTNATVLSKAGLDSAAAEYDDLLVRPNQARDPERLTHIERAFSYVHVT